MRIFSVIVTAVLLSSCGESKPPTIPEMINNLDPKACAAQDVKTGLLNIAQPKYSAFLADGLQPLEIDTISVTGIDEATKQITCAANLKAREYGQGSEFPITVKPANLVYKLRPMLEDETNFVIEVLDAPSVRDAINTHNQWSKHFLQQAAQQGQNPAKEAADAAVAAMAPDTNASYDQPDPSDLCTASVLQTVAAIESPDSKLKAGEKFYDVTQFWRVKATGFTYFCAKGEYCYPSHVTQNGQKVEAFKLDNCSVSRDGDDQGEEILYYVG